MRDLPPDYLTIPTRINITAATVDRQVAPGHGERIALYDDAAITYRELQRRVNQCGNALARIGIGRGDRYFLRAPNSPDEDGHRQNPQTRAARRLTGRLIQRLVNEAPRGSPLGCG